MAQGRKSVGPCCWPGCDRDARTNGMCRRDDERTRRLALAPSTCSFSGCVKDARTGNVGLCAMHYRRTVRRGSPDDAALSRRPNGAGGTRKELRREYEATRRAKKRGQFVERVYLANIWNRDAGICHICGLLADPDDWELDHVVPISRGGEHSHANTAVSHPKCNHLKGDR